MRFLLWLFCPLLVATQVPAQPSHADSTNSPVFRSYRSRNPLPVPEETDATWQMWLTFMASQKANAGDVLAQHELGLRFLLGRGVAADTVKGAYWIQRAASRNLVPARFNLGILELNGWGVAWNPFEAYRQFEYCANTGMVEARYIVGLIYTENLVVPRDLVRARQWLAMAADSGYAPARDAIRQIEAMTRTQDSPDSTGVTAGLLFGGFEDDSSSARSDATLLRDALEQAGPEVRKALGIAGLADSSAQIDATTLSSLQSAAAAGSPEALSVIGRCYERGTLVRKDPVLAAMYYVRAIRLDYPRASEYLWRLLQEESFYGVLTAQAGEGNVNARYTWATLSAIGFGGVLFRHNVFITDQQALGFLRYNVQKQDPQSMIELGLWYYGGRAGTEDVERAVSLWRDAAGLGSAEAKLRIAVTTVRASRDSAAVREAVAVLTDASAGGSVLAQVALGYCYETGRGVARNTTEAVRLYRSGAQRGSQDAYRALRRMYDAVRPPDRAFEIPYGM